MYDGTNEKALLKALGKPSKEAIDGVTKKATYDKYNSWFYLTKRTIYMLGISIGEEK
jgi:hypothetical protein